MWPVRVLALVVVLPFRVLWEGLTLAGRFLVRYVLAPLGEAMAWLWRYAVAIPAAWVWRYLIAIPVVWVCRYLVAVPAVWIWRHLIVAPGMWLAGPAAWSWRYLVAVPVGWLWRAVIAPAPLVFYRWVLRPIGIGVAATVRFLVDCVVNPVLVPVGRAIIWFLTAGWKGTAWLAVRFYRWVLRPIGIGLAWTWRYSFGALFRGLAYTWNVTVRPTLGWLRIAVGWRR